MPTVSGEEEGLISFPFFFSNNCSIQWNLIIKLQNYQELDESFFELYPNNQTNEITLKTSSEQIDEKLITLSSLPRSRWHNLLNLETIKVFFPCFSLNQCN